MRSSSSYVTDRSFPPWSSAAQPAVARAGDSNSPCIPHGLPAHMQQNSVSCSMPRTDGTARWAPSPPGAEHAGQFTSDSRERGPPDSTVSNSKLRQKADKPGTHSPGGYSAGYHTTHGSGGQGPGALGHWPGANARQSMMQRTQPWSAAGSNTPTQLKMCSNQRPMLRNGSPTGSTYSTGVRPGSPGVTSKPGSPGSTCSAAARLGLPGTRLGARPGSPGARPAVRGVWQEAAATSQNGLRSQQHGRPLSPTASYRAPGQPITTQGKTSYKTASGVGSHTPAVPTTAHGMQHGQHAGFSGTHALRDARVTRTNTWSAIGKVAAQHIQRVPVHREASCPVRQAALMPATPQAMHQRQGSLLTQPSPRALSAPCKSRLVAHQLDMLQCSTHSILSTPTATHAAQAGWRPSQPTSAAGSAHGWQPAAQGQESCSVHTTAEQHAATTAAGGGAAEQLWRGWAARKQPSQAAASHAMPSMPHTPQHAQHMQQQTAQLQDEQGGNSAHQPSPSSSRHGSPSPLRAVKGLLGGFFRRDQTAVSPVRQGSSAAVEAGKAAKEGNDAASAGTAGVRSPSPDAQLTPSAINRQAELSPRQTPVPHGYASPCTLAPACVNGARSKAKPRACWGDTASGAHASSGSAGSSHHPTAVHPVSTTGSPAGTSRSARLLQRQQAGLATAAPATAHNSASRTSLAGQLTNRSSAAGAQQRVGSPGRPAAGRSHSPGISTRAASGSSGGVVHKATHNAANVHSHSPHRPIPTTARSGTGALKSQRPLQQCADADYARILKRPPQKGLTGQQVMSSKANSQPKAGHLSTADKRAPAHGKVSASSTPPRQMDLPEEGHMDAHLPEGELSWDGCWDSPTNAHQDPSVLGSEHVGGLDGHAQDLDMPPDGLVAARTAEALGQARPRLSSNLQFSSHPLPILDPLSPCSSCSTMPDPQVAPAAVHHHNSSRGSSRPVAPQEYQQGMPSRLGLSTELATQQSQERLSLQLQRELLLAQQQHEQAPSAADLRQQLRAALANRLPPSCSLLPFPAIRDGLPALHALLGDDSLRQLLQLLLPLTQTPSTSPPATREHRELQPAQQQHGPAGRRQHNHLKEQETNTSSLHPSERASRAQGLRSTADGSSGGSLADVVAALLAEQRQQGQQHQGMHSRRSSISSANGLVSPYYMVHPHTPGSIRVRPGNAVSGAGALSTVNPMFDCSQSNRDSLDTQGDTQLYGGLQLCDGRQQGTDACCQTDADPWHHSAPDLYSSDSPDPAGQSCAARQGRYTANQGCYSTHPMGDAADWGCYTVQPMGGAAALQAVFLPAPIHHNSANILPCTSSEGGNSAADASIAVADYPTAICIAEASPTRRINKAAMGDVGQCQKLAVAHLIQSRPPVDPVQHLQPALVMQLHSVQPEDHADQWKAACNGMGFMATPAQQRLPDRILCDSPSSLPDASSSPIEQHVLGLGPSLRSKKVAEQGTTQMTLPMAEPALPARALPAQQPATGVTSAATSHLRSLPLTESLAESDGADEHSLHSPVTSPTSHQPCGSLPNSQCGDMSRITAQGKEGRDLHNADLSQGQRQSCAASQPTSPTATLLHTSNMGTGHLPAMQVLPWMLLPAAALLVSPQAQPKPLQHQPQLAAPRPQQGQQHTQLSPQSAEQHLPQNPQHMQLSRQQVPTAQEQLTAAQGLHPPWQLQLQPPPPLVQVFQAAPQVTQPSPQQSNLVQEAQLLRNQLQLQGQGQLLAAAQARPQQVAMQEQQQRQSQQPDHQQPHTGVWASKQLSPDATNVSSTHRVLPRVQAASSENVACSDPLPSHNADDMGLAPHPHISSLTLQQIAGTLLTDMTAPVQQPASGAVTAAAPMTTATPAESNPAAGGAALHHKASDYTQILCASPGVEAKAGCQMQDNWLSVTSTDGVMLAGAVVTDVQHGLTPIPSLHRDSAGTDVSCHAFSPADAAHHNFTPADAAHHNFTPANAAHHTWAPADAAHHTLTPADAAHQPSPVAESIEAVEMTGLGFQTIAAAPVLACTWSGLPADIQLQPSMPSLIQPKALHTAPPAGTLSSRHSEVEAEDLVTAVRWPSFSRTQQASQSGAATAGRDSQTAAAAASTQQQPCMGGLSQLNPLAEKVNNAVHFNNAAQLPDSGHCLTDASVPMVTIAPQHSAEPPYSLLGTNSSQQRQGADIHGLSDLSTPLQSVVGVAHVQDNLQHHMPAEVHRTGNSITRPVPVRKCDPPDDDHSNAPYAAAGCGSFWSAACRVLSPFSSPRQSRSPSRSPRSPAATPTKAVHSTKPCQAMQQPITSSKSDSWQMFEQGPIKGPMHSGMHNWPRAHEQVKAAGTCELEAGLGCGNNLQQAVRPSFLISTASDGLDSQPVLGAVTQPVPQWQHLPLCPSPALLPYTSPQQNTNLHTVSTSDINPQLAASITEPSTTTRPGHTDAPQEHQPSLNVLLDHMTAARRSYAGNADTIAGPAVPPACVQGSAQLCCQAGASEDRWDGFIPSTVRHSSPALTACVMRDAAAIAPVTAAKPTLAAMGNRAEDQVWATLPSNNTSGSANAAAAVAADQASQGQMAILDPASPAAKPHLNSPAAGSQHHSIAQVQPSPAVVVQPTAIGHASHEVGDISWVPQLVYDRSDTSLASTASDDSMQCRRSDCSRAGSEASLSPSKPRRRAKHQGVSQTVQPDDQLSVLATTEMYPQAGHSTQFPHIPPITGDGQMRRVASVTASSPPGNTTAGSAANKSGRLFHSPQHVLQHVGGAARHLLLQPLSPLMQKCRTPSSQNLSHRSSHRANHARAGVQSTVLHHTLNSSLQADRGHAIRDSSIAAAQGPAGSSHSKGRAQIGGLLAHGAAGLLVGLIGASTADNCKKGLKPLGYRSASYKQRHSLHLDEMPSQEVDVSMQTCQVLQPSVSLYHALQQTPLY